MTTTRLRAVYLTLTMTVALPLLVGILVNAMSQALANDWKHYWPYFVAAAVLILATLVRNRMRSHPAVDLTEVADRLARSIAGQWTAEAATRKINDPVTLPVPWRVFRDCATGGALGHLRRVSPVDDLLSAIPTQRLIILGGPGAGKTGLLVDLVLRILRRQDRETDWADRPHRDRIVPVLFSLSSWSPDQPLSDWLVDRLHTEHPELQAPEHNEPDGPYPGSCPGRAEPGPAGAGRFR